jgi:hypothetical protein
VAAARLSVLRAPNDCSFFWMGPAGDSSAFEMPYDSIVLRIIVFAHHSKISFGHFSGPRAFTPGRNLLSRNVVAVSVLFFYSASPPSC